MLCPDPSTIHDLQQAWAFVQWKHVYRRARSLLHSGFPPEIVERTLYRQYDYPLVHAAVKAAA